MAVRIMAVGSYLPERILTNDELSARIDTSDEWIRSHTGIGARHVASDDQATSDLAARAAKAAMDKAGVGVDDIDLVVLATATPDYAGFPSTSCMMSNILGIKKAPSFDIAAGCTGFIYALDVARGMMVANPGYRKALVVGAELLTRILDWEDRATCVLFGDGAGAVVLENGAGEGILNSTLGADASGWDKIIFRRGGSREPIKAGETFTKAPALAIDGRAVYNFAVQAVCDLMKKLSEDSGIALNDFTHIVPHQANARIIQAAAKRLGVPESRFYMNMERVANTSSASVPLALDEMDAAGTLKRGDTVMIMAFGAGLTYGGSVIKW